MKLPKLRELLEAVKSLVHRPYTSKFPMSLHAVPELMANHHDQNRCLGCLARGSLSTEASPTATHRGGKPEE
jgi:hypothetical protein